MPEFNVHALSSLLGYMSTGLGIFLTIPSLVFGWRDEVAYLSFATNWIWSLAEAASLAGLLLVPEPLLFSLVLVIWYLTSDLLFCLEAIIVKGYLKAAYVSPSRFAQRRLRDWWSKKEREKWVLEKHADHRRRPTKLQVALTREDTYYEKTYIGARWRRDIEIQIGALGIGVVGTVIIWYIVFFRTGRASEPYKWEKSVLSEFTRKELIGWGLGWLSSVLYILGRVQADWQVRNFFIGLWNRTRHGSKKQNYVSPRPSPSPLDQSYGVAAVLQVVFYVFIIDNLLQIIGMCIILIDQDTRTRNQYALFQMPWIAGSVLAIGVDIKMIMNYRASMQFQAGSDARVHGKWRYAPGHFPKKQLDFTVEQTFLKIWNNKTERSRLLDDHRKAKTRVGTRQDARDHAALVERADDLQGEERKEDPFYRSEGVEALRTQEKAHFDAVAGRRRAAASRQIGRLKKHAYHPVPTPDPHQGLPLPSYVDERPASSPTSPPRRKSLDLPTTVPPPRRNSLSLAHRQYRHQSPQDSFLGFSDSGSDLSDSDSDDEEMRKRHRSSRFSRGRRGSGSSAELLV